VRPDFKDLTIEILADSEAQLRAERDQVIEAFANLAFDNVVLRQVLEAEMAKRFQAEATLDRIRRQHAQPRKAAA
jgi:hypothetical protein